MNEMQKLTMELIWESTRFYEDFKPHFVNNKVSAELRMGLARVLVTIHTRCGSIQDATFLRRKNDLAKVLFGYPKTGELNGQLTTWSSYLEETKNSIHSRTLKTVRLYLLDLRAELNNKPENLPMRK
jgi:hypothetical protein